MPDTISTDLVRVFAERKMNDADVRESEEHGKPYVSLVETEEVTLGDERWKGGKKEIHVELRDGDGDGAGWTKGTR